jgi:hypothetical protein
LNDFLGKKGAHAGNTSAVFYAEYVFLEKLRTRDKKPKAKHRQTMEGSGGLDTKRRNNGRVYVFTRQQAYEDKFGRIHTS